MSANDERAQLQRARELIVQKQFAEARAILRRMPANPTAQQWLAKLDTIAPETTSASPAAPAAGVTSETPTGTPPPVSGVPGSAVPSSARPQSERVNVVFDLDLRLARYVLAGMTGVFAVLMIAAFFLVPWMDLGDVSFMGFSADAFGGEVDQDPLEITAWEIWIGRNAGESFTLDLEAEAEAEGFADVRLIDRFLILIPVLALILLWLAFVYAFPGDMRISLVTIAGFMAVFAFVLLLFPFAWEELSTEALEDDLTGAMEMEGDLGDFEGFFDMGMFTGIYTDAYSTGEQQVLGLLALIAALAAFVVEFMSGGSRRRTALPPPPAAV